MAETETTVTVKADLSQLQELIDETLHALALSDSTRINLAEMLEAEQKAHATTKEALEAAEATNKAFVDRATDSGGSVQLEFNQRRLATLLRRWRSDAAIDHRLPLETVELLRELGEEP